MLQGIVDWKQAGPAAIPQLQMLAIAGFGGGIVPGETGISEAYGAPAGRPVVPEQHLRIYLMTNRY
jgi:hypothetical protein